MSEVILQGSTLLVATLGASWAVVPEAFAALAPQRCRLLASNERRGALAEWRARHDLAAPDEVWVLTTGGQRAQDGARELIEWWQRNVPEVPLRIWVAAKTDGLASAEECSRFAELAMRAVLHATERAGPGNVVLSLAGGRKTMSADLQRAAQFFGCRGLLHVVTPEPLPAELRSLPDGELSEGAAAGVVPLVVGAPRRSEAADVHSEALSRLEASRFAFPFAEAGTIATVELQTAELLAAVEQRERQAAVLVANYVDELTSGSRADQFPALLLLGPQQLRRLRETRVDDSHRELLVRLPKADLHRHLGGALSLGQQRRVAGALLNELGGDARRDVTPLVRELLAQARHGERWPWSWVASLKELSPNDRAVASSVLLDELSEEQLSAQLFGPTEPRVALTSHHERGFAAYERPGDLSASAAPWVRST